MAASRGGDTSEHIVPMPTGTTRTTILDVAQRLFTEQGFDGTSLRQIADAVGTTKAAVYYHFPAKEHLLVELTRPWLDEMSAFVTEIRSGDRNGADASATLAAYLDLFIKHLPVLHMLAGDPATQNHPDIGRRARALVETVQQRIAGPEPSDGQLVRAACALGVVHSVSTLSVELVGAHRDAILAAAVAALSATPERSRPARRQPIRRNVATQ